MTVTVMGGREEPNWIFEVLCIILYFIELYQLL